MAPETGANAFDDPDKVDSSGVSAAVRCAEGGWAQPVLTGPAGCSRWSYLASDRPCVMRLAPVVGRATSVFARAGRFR
jgi:hypothetical protein